MGSGASQLQLQSLHEQVRTEAVKPHDVSDMPDDPAELKKEIARLRELCGTAIENWHGDQQVAPISTPLSTSSPVADEVIVPVVKEQLEPHKSSETLKPTDVNETDQHPPPEPLNSVRKQAKPSHRAISLEALVDFTNKHDLWDKETWWVAENIIMPATLPDSADGDGQGGPPKRYYELLPPEDVGKVDVFLSHTWGNSWGLLVAAALHFVQCLSAGEEEFRITMGAGLHHISQKFVKISKKRKVRVWIDVFAVMQHATDGKAVDVNSLGEVVDASLVTLMVLDKQSAAPLSRIWCLYEMIMTAESFEKHKVETVKLEKGNNTVELKPNHVFHVRIGSSDGDSFSAAMPKEIKKVFHQTDVENAQAKYEEDRLMVLKLAGAVKTKKYGQGFSAINKMAKQALSNVLSYAEL